MGRTLFGFLYGVHGVPHFLFPGSLISIFFGVQRTAHLNRNDDDDSSSIVKLQDENLGAFSFSGFINFPDLAIETDLHLFFFSCYFVSFSVVVYKEKKLAAPLAVTVSC